jgi:hypothetical protein
MKRILIALSFFVLCTQHTAFSMDIEMNFEDLYDDFWRQTGLEFIGQKKEPLTQQPKKQIPFTEELNKLVSTIDAAINKKYSAQFFEVFLELTSQDFFDIMSLIAQYTNAPSRALLNKLYKKNSSCKQALEYFLAFAQRNINKVTFYSLEAIQNPTAQQKVAQLNKLPAPIKQLLMESAYNKTTGEYTINLKGHTDKITFFDICTVTHHAATSSLDKTLRLWNLQTGKYVLTFPEKNADTISCIAFNHDGSLLATIKQVRAGTPKVIDLWDTKSAQRLHTIQHNNTNLQTSSEYSNDVKMLVGVIKTYAQYNANNPNARYYRTHWNNKYHTQYLPRCNPHATLSIKKLNCRSLTICEHMVKNTPNLLLEHFEQKPLFNELTEYEKNIATKSLVDKEQYKINKTQSKQSKQIPYGFF